MPMEKLERISFLDATKEDEATISNKRKAFGLYPYLIILLLIITVSIGVLFTNQEISKIVIEKNNLVHRIDTIQNTNRIITKEIDDMNTKKNNLNQQINSKNEIIKKLKKHLDDVKKQINQYDEIIDEFGTQLINHKKQIKDLKESIISLKEEANRITQRHANYLIESKDIDESTQILETEKDFKFIFQLTGANTIALCYSSEVNGFDINLFHKKCDDVSPSLIIYETQHRERIGGYTELLWTGEEGEFDSNAILFNLESQKAFPIEDFEKKRKILIPNQNLFPSFGAFHDKYDLFIYQNNKDFEHDDDNEDMFTTQIRGHSDFPVCFEGDKNDTLSQLKDFGILAVEIFQIK